MEVTVGRDEIAAYCREIEGYLCRKNGGHLVRVVGPAFEEVRGWAAQGVPLKIALRGIDQYCERAFAKGPRRRPVRIEFCAADILELFDDWRRAIGVATESDAQPAARKPALAAHVERVIARLIGLRTVDGAAPLPAAAIDEAVAALDRVGTLSRKARGDGRDALLQELVEIDRRLFELIAGSLDAATSGRLRTEAEEELAPFGQRIAPDARAAAVDAAYARLVRDMARLPRVSFE